jgi:hypothetical protein
MREHVNNASRRRDERLARVRKLSLWITGGAAAASLGMGTAFAHAIPGHTVSSGGSSTATGGTAHSSSPGSAGTGTEAGTARKAGGHHRHRLAPPASAPAPAPAAPAAPVSSGGS